MINKKMKNNGGYIVYSKYFRIYRNGAYCKYEVALGRRNGYGCTWYLNTLNGQWLEFRIQLSLKYIENMLQKYGV